MLLQAIIYCKFMFCVIASATLFLLAIESRNLGEDESPRSPTPISLPTASLLYLLPSSYILYSRPPHSIQSSGFTAFSLVIIVSTAYFVSFWHFFYVITVFSSCSLLLLHCFVAFNAFFCLGFLLAHFDFSTFWHVKFVRK